MYASDSRVNPRLGKLCIQRWHFPSKLVLVIDNPIADLLIGVLPGVFVGIQSWSSQIVSVFFAILVMTVGAGDQ